jgi:hypothetical protein
VGKSDQLLDHSASPFILLSGSVYMVSKIKRELDQQGKTSQKSFLQEHPIEGLSLAKIPLGAVSVQSFFMKASSRYFAYLLARALIIVYLLLCWKPK